MNAPNTPNQLDLLSSETATRKPRASAFAERGFRATVEQLQAEVRELYCADDSPWIVGYSGGKDSTATLQLVWSAIAELPTERRRKPIHVISTDTLVENPIVSAWVERSIRTMKEAAHVQGVPIEPRMLWPELQDRFWVNLIGRGYPAPRHKFRWCTERLKILPSNRFISKIVSKNGQAILCLGTRKAESSQRSAVMQKHEVGRVRDRLSPNSKLPGSWVYTPIESWTNDDVWFFLMQEANIWGFDNRELLQMYAGASEDGECPLVVDDSTPSCGDSRFGCWVCTMVEQDRSMTAMIQNDVEKEWMLPLLDLRNALDFRGGRQDALGNPDTDRHLRDFRRMNGSVQIMQGGRPIPGPYVQEARENWLRMLLKAQCHIRKHGPDEVRDLELIKLEELQEIRRIWVIDKHELEDRLPGIYEEVTGEPYPGTPLDDNLSLGAAEMALLRELCGEDRLHYELTRELLSITRQQRSSARRARLNQRIEQAFARHYFDDADDAIARARASAEARKALDQRRAGVGGPPDLVDAAMPA
uniref:DNA phosphorothioation system sulfurtransferase DndC n=1 Tax=uncultured Thiohalocapsa sp. TaxID=768990 RepID=UPI0025F54629